MIQRIKNFFGKSKKTAVTSTMALMAVMAMASSAFAAPAAPNSGNTNVDKYLDGFVGVFGLAENGFVYLAIASIAVTIAVVIFFWLRGKAKQAINGA